MATYCKNCDNATMDNDFESGLCDDCWEEEAEEYRVWVTETGSEEWAIKARNKREAEEKASEKYNAGQTISPLNCEVTFEALSDDNS